MDWSNLTGDDEAQEPLCIQFANTVGNRGGPQPTEGLRTPQALIEWFLHAGVTGRSVQIDETFLARAISLREDIFRLLSGEADDGQGFRRELQMALSHLTLSAGFEWHLFGTDASQVALMKIALSAADLLSSPLRERVKVCGDPVCGWLFLDRSKNHSRRWCSMSDCGNLAKARRLRERRRA